MVWKLVPVLVMAALTPAPVSLAGASARTWTSTPTQGPSPNTISVSGEGCYFNIDNEIEATGIASLGGENGLVAYGEVTVRLHEKTNPGVVLEEEEYTASQTSPTVGDWSGSFPIPAGLQPGTYPLKAECSALIAVGEYGVTLGGGAEVSFEYEPDRSYTVVAESDAPDPVEAEVTFTG